MKVWIISAITIAILISALIIINKPQTSQTPISTPTPTPEVINITASFKIITSNITRSFLAEKYHNKSADVYITADNPTLVHVTKKGITWDDFFKTLPMKLTKDCLVTGDGETLCDGKNGVLKFFLNDIEDKDLLDKEIKQDDQILIKFTSQ